MDKNKLKNYSFVASLLSGIALVVVQVLAIFEIYIKDEIISNIISAILGLLVGIGIIIAPKNDKNTENSTNENEENDENLTDDNNKTK